MLVRSSGPAEIDAHGFIKSGPDLSSAQAASNALRQSGEGSIAIAFVHQVLNEL